MWLVGFRYMFGKNCSWGLCTTKNMYKIFGSCVVAVAFQSVFYLEMHQNNYFWYQRIKMIWKKKIEVKKFNFFQKRFWNTKTNRVLRNSVTKACKNCFSKTAFQTQFFSGSHSKKRSLVCYQTPYCVFCTANAKATSKQTQPMCVKIQ